MLPEGIDFAFHWARMASCISRGKERYQKYMKRQKKTTRIPLIENVFCFAWWRYSKTYPAEYR